MRAIFAVQGWALLAALACHDRRRQSTQGRHVRVHAAASVHDRIRHHVERPVPWRQIVAPVPSSLPLVVQQARFGPWRLRTPLANVTAVEITGPYAFMKTAGPAHLGITDRGLTFASNGDRGVLITFRRPVPGIEGPGRLRHPELTVTLADVEGLAALLRERMAG